jgi:hypothetical protein
MGSKILRKVAMQIQPSTTYAATVMNQMAFSDGIFNQGFDPIEDDGIIGVGFNNTPLQGLRHVGGSYSFNLDPLTIPILLEATLGRKATTAYDFNGSHNVNMSIAELNAINCVQYTSCYSKALKLSGSKGGLIKVDADIFSIRIQNRGATSTYPAPTVSAGVPMSFHELGGANGYVRLGDQADVLAAGDDIKIESFNIDIVSGFDESYANENDVGTPEALASLIPVWGMVPPSVKCSFKIPRYSLEQYQTWQAANTPLQLEFYAYKSATSTVKIQIPNLVIKAALESGELTTVNVECMIGRNGVSTSYTNAYMTFNSPIKFTVVNS